jgi:hypothetical protein
MRERSKADRLESSNCLCRQGVEVLSGSLPFAAVFHLPSPDHVHEFDAGGKDAGAAKIFEAERRSGSTFDGTAVLLDDVVQVLGLPDDDRLPALGVPCRRPGTDTSTHP